MDLFCFIRDFGPRPRFGCCFKTDSAQSSIQNVTMLSGFFSNLIFAIIARILCGNHLKHAKKEFDQSPAVLTYM